MKTTIKQKLPMILLIIVIIITIWFINKSANKTISELDSKLEYTQQALIDSNRALESAKKPSQIERLWGTADQFKRQSDKTLEEIIEKQSKYEFELLTYRCFKNQVNRMMEFEEVDEEFCMVEENLEEFRKK